MLNQAVLTALLHLSPSKNRVYFNNPKSWISDWAGFIQKNFLGERNLNIHSSGLFFFFFSPLGSCRAGFLNPSTPDILSRIILCCVGCAGHCRIFSSILASIHSPSCNNFLVVSKQCQVSPGGHLPVEIPWPRVSGCSLQGSYTSVSPSSLEPTCPAPTSGKCAGLGRDAISPSSVSCWLA